jgi:Domain of unknown function (DUF4173)
MELGESLKKLTIHDMPSQLNPRFLILISSIISTFLLVNNNYFPFTGWSIFGIVLAFFVIITKANRAKFDYFFFIVAIVSALNFFFKTNFITLFFSFTTYIYALGWMITGLHRNRYVQIFQLLIPYGNALFSTLGMLDSLPKLFPKKDSETLEISPEIEPKKIEQVGIGWKIAVNTLLSIIILSVILPLLSFANPVFGQYVNDIINLEFVRQVLENIFSFESVLRILVGVSLYNLLPRLYCLLRESKVVEPVESQDSPIEIPKVVTILTLLAFLGVQLQTILNPQLLSKNSGDIANEIFFQLSIVCFVSFVLVFFNFRDKVRTMVLSLILLVETFLVGMIAFQSDWNYVINWGLTHKRLYGFSILAIILGIILTFVAFSFIRSKKIVLYLAFIFILVSVITNSINFDYLIYRNPPIETEGIEQDYISRMSLDSYSLADIYPEIVDKIKTFQIYETIESNCSEFHWLRDNNRQLDYLQTKYSSSQFLTFNYNEFQNYQTVKNLNKFDYLNSNLQTSNDSLNTKNNCYPRRYNNSWD